MAYQPFRYVNNVSKVIRAKRHYLILRLRGGVRVKRKGNAREGRGMEWKEGDGGKGGRKGGNSRER